MDSSLACRFSTLFSTRLQPRRHLSACWRQAEADSCTGVCACVCYPHLRLPAFPQLLLCLLSAPERSDISGSWGRRRGPSLGSADLPLGLQLQPLRPLCQQLLAALQLVDAHVHVADGGHALLPALAELHHLWESRGHRFAGWPGKRGGGGGARRVGSPSHRPAG